MFRDLYSEFISLYRTIKLHINKISKNKRNMILCDDLNELPDKELIKINDLFIRGRHHNCSIIYLSQYFYRIPIRSRGSANYFIFFKLNSEKKVIK